MEKTMSIKLEAGKYYKRRDGEKVYCVGIDPFSVTSGSDFIYVIAREKHGPLMYTESGISEDGYEGESSDCDIIAEWVDEPAPSGINVSSGGTTFTQTAATMPAISNKPNLNISEWWVGIFVDDDEYILPTAFFKNRHDINDPIFGYVMQVKDWIAVQMGLKNIEEFKV